MYITYDEYADMGGTVSESAFPALCKKAEVTIDYYTQDRLKGLTDRPDNLSYLMVELIDLLHNTTGGDKVTSVSHDGISVSFSDEDIEENQILALVDLYLPEYTYRGVDS